MLKLIQQEEIGSLVSSFLCASPTGIALRGSSETDLKDFNLIDFICYYNEFHLQLSRRIDVYITNLLLILEIGIRVILHLAYLLRELVFLMAFRRLLKWPCI